jgi:predicted enzyme related to lactoylglutathione lyase
MSKQTKTKSKNGKNNGTSSIVWFEIPADNVERARTFYGKLFGWKITEFPGAKKPYWFIETGGDKEMADGGMMERQHPDHGITNYVAVPSVDQAAAKVEKLGGKICMEKTAVPEMGYFVVCEDTENNTFALWERNEKAK